MGPESSFRTSNPAVLMDCGACAAVEEEMGGIFWVMVGRGMPIPTPSDLNCIFNDMGTLQATVQKVPEPTMTLTKLQLNIGPNLYPDQWKQLLALLWKYTNVFAYSPMELGSTVRWLSTELTLGAHPVHNPPHHLNPALHMNKSEVEAI